MMPRTVVLVSLLAFITTARAAEPALEMRAAVSPRLASAELVSAADPAEVLTMSVTLQPQHQDELEALLAAQQRPGSPEYHRWLSPQEYAARFGAAAEDYDSVADWLRTQGFTIRTWSGRSRIDFTGAVAGVETAFGVRMNVYRHRGRRVLANATPPQLPAGVAAAVRSLRLNTFRLADPVVKLVDTTGATTDALAPADLHTAYDSSPTLNGGIDGAGQTIAIAARSDFNLSDVALFQRQFGLAVRAPTKVFPGSNPGVGAPNGTCAGLPSRQKQTCVLDEESEVLLDTEWAGAAAPGAAVLVDISDADIDVSLADIVSHHPEAKIVSVSFALCERFEPSLVAAMEPIYAQAAAQGQTVLVAAGNSGADGCEDGKGASVNALASSARVTSVGGTALDPGFDARGNATGHVSEVVWNDSDGAGGGGVSTLVLKPAYQNGPGVPADGFRDQPDVALMASPSQVGYVFAIENGLGIIGGTSVATPSWAGTVALANQAAGRDGSGMINDALYALGRGQYAAGATAVFHDITSGDNTLDGVSGFAATPGYDPASGLGSPDVALLVQALSAPQCAGDCNHDGVVTVDEVLTAIDIALGVTPLTDCSSIDTNVDGQVTVDEILAVTSNALNGC